MVTRLSQGVSYSYDERGQLLTVYRRGVKLEEQCRLDTPTERKSRAMELLRQLYVRDHA